MSNLRPGHTPQQVNAATAFLLQVDDGPLQSKLGFYEEEPLLGA